MSNKKHITIFSILALIILAIVIIITIVSGLTGFSIILGALFIILTICLGIYLKEEPDQYTAYIKSKNKILKTYDSIIVEVENIPNIAGKNIIKVKSIEDLVDAQLELREPIYYKNDNDSCFFLLLHYNEACIFILKMNDNIVSPTEQSIKYMKIESKDGNENNILENVENTIVYKLDELRSFKISPIRNEQKIEVVDDTAIKEEIKNSQENSVTREALSDEISKTMYIKNLREKMEKYTIEEEQKEAPIIPEKKIAIKEQTKVPKKLSPKSPKLRNNHSNRRTKQYSKKTVK